MQWAQLGQHFWSFGIAFGLITASVISSLVTLWEWLQNPGGVFYAGGTTQWDNVLATFTSWFMPTFFYAGLAAAIGHLSISLLTQWLSKKK
ncbi:hypothetical protein [Shewanella waksmanii]|uniref:hypothetical protein n=1 Tax=Shewanella waksmanii TaxID=213783 RepID=UPI0037354C1C